MPTLQPQRVRAAENGATLARHTVICRQQVQRIEIAVALPNRQAQAESR